MLRTGNRRLLAAVAALALAAGGVAAEPAKKERSINANYTHADAVKAQKYLDAAMAMPMLDLLSKANVTNPEVMLEYGLALELGRPSEAANLPQGVKDELKRGYRTMLDQYLNAGDKKDPVLADANFESDAMLDNQEFWVDLAKQIGRRKEHEQLNQQIPADSVGGMGGSFMTFIPDPQNEDNGLNLNRDLVLDRSEVNAAVSCAESAAGFAKMRKAQLIDVAATKLTPEQFAEAKATAVKTYRIAYSTGVEACGDETYFMKVADFAAQNLGILGTLKDDPNATLAPLNTADDTGTAAPNS